jgi:hypothetical protein
MKDSVKDILSAKSDTKAVLDQITGKSKKAETK